MTTYDTPTKNCGACERGAHIECWSVLSPHPDDACACFHADVDRHMTDEAIYFATHGDYLHAEEW